jgi:hypothetical protein
MNRYEIIWILVSVISISTSCREVYYPDDISSPQQILVIQGMICEGTVPAVNLSYAMGYYENLVIPVTDATVIVADDHGNQVELSHQSSGSYKPVTDVFKGIRGNIYTLHIYTSDGNEYESASVKIGEKPIIDSVYANPGLREVYNSNPYGEPISETQEGLYILADLSAETDSTVYYRFNTSLLQEITYTLAPNSFNPIMVYEWQCSVLDNLYSVDKSIQNNNRQIVPRHKIGYLQWFYDPSLNTDASTAPYTYAWVLTSKVYTISTGIYNYYHSIEQQLNSNNQMFAPIPSQVKSNIHCINDPGKTVSGVFEASSMSVCYKAFRYDNLKSYRSKTLVEFPEITKSGTKRYLAPDFWIWL